MSIESIECIDTDIEETEGISPIGPGDVSFLRPLGTICWSAASGRQIPHIVYSLRGCPPVDAATYLLVRHTEHGREILAVRATLSAFSRMNLARIRRTGARIGANEVHLFHGPASKQERRKLVLDLERALCSRPGHATGSRRRQGHRALTTPAPR